MAILEVVEQIIKEAEGQRAEEREVLEKIAGLTDLEFAEKAADLFDCKKHLYEFRGYLTRLNRLYALLQYGVSPVKAMEAAECCSSIEKLISYYQEEEKR